MLKQIEEKYLAASIDWDTYMEITQSLLQEGKTTGSNQSEAMVNYTKLNMQRSKRWMKSYQVSQALAIKVQEAEAMVWLVITEPWCGDAAHNIPPMVKMSALNPKINLRIVFRDEHPELMDHFHTNGAKSVPKLIVLEHESLRVIDTWGPRPKVFQDMVINEKNNPTMPMMDFYELLHQRYNQNKQQEFEKEFLDNLAKWKSVVEDQV